MTRQADRALATWDDYGCVPNDPTVDNGPLLSRILADQIARRIEIPPAGKLADYYVETPIRWPNGHGAALVGSGGYTYSIGRKDIGCTRLVWTGRRGDSMIVYRGHGGRIAQLMLCGAPLGESGFVAGCGILVEAHGGRGNRHAIPSGKLITDQISITNTERGIECVNEPDANHADHLTHYSPLFHDVRVPYRVDCSQSVVHTIYNMDVRAGTRRVFEMLRGGALNVYGCYWGLNRDATLLYIGKATSNNGSYEIHGLHVDASAENMRLVDHGKYAHRVRVSGNVASGATLADPPVLQREGPSRYADVRVDCTGVRWPRRDQP